MSDSPDPQRKRHPLEEPPYEPPTGAPPPDEPAQPRIRLQIPVVPPRVTFALIAINVLVFALGFLSPQLDRELFSFGASRAYEVLVLGEYHRLFTAMFLHAGLAHIFFNMYALFIFGQSLEPFFGSPRFLLIYLLGGLAGSVLSIFIGGMNLPGAASVGASGAVFAIFGAEMVFLYRHRQLLGERANAQLRNLLVLLGVNLAIGLLSSLETSAIRIDNWAHIGGLIGGLALTWFAGPVLGVTPHPTRPLLLVATDKNPLEKQYSVFVIYGLILVGVLAVATFVARA